ADPAFAPDDPSRPFSVHTRWIETEFENDIPPYSGPVGDRPDDPPREQLVVEVDGKRLEVSLPGGLSFGAGHAVAARQKAPRRSSGGRGAAATSGNALTAPMQGTIVRVAVADGARVAAGDLVVVLEAMKMEQPITAHRDGTVTGLAAEVGATVASGAVLCEITDAG
ncbi:MAG: acetyl-CoA carboxylase biotin carboxyl carrier protein subunit, partial [Dermatophilaceae bacterium]